MGGGAAAAAAAAPGFGAALVSRWIGGVRPGSSVEEQSHGGGGGKDVAKLCEAMASRAQRSINDNGHADVAELSTVSATIWGVGRNETIVAPRGVGFFAKGFISAAAPAVCLLVAGEGAEEMAVGEAATETLAEN
uniref:Uncharacterized protein n=1 Tax=Oryza glumipatula TaxID=40148 RepID=A0A0E0BBP3_9ORYZ